MSERIIMNKGYGICLNEWLEDSRIKNELRLLIKISSLTAESGVCFASNPYFAKYFNTAEETISRQIKKLEKLEYIKAEYEKRGAEITKRLLRLTKTSTVGCQKHQSTIDENVKDNNTSINNTSLIKEKINKKKIFSFSLSNKQSYDNLSQEYKDKLKAKCLLTDGNLQRYNDFIDQLEAKGYQYKDFSKAYIVWDKEKKYQSFTPEPEPKLGDDWVKVVTGYDTVIAINTKTLETKEGVLKR